MTGSGGRTYAHVRSRALGRLLRCPLVALASHWTFQGVTQMDPTERRFRLGLEVAVTAGLRQLLGRRGRPLAATWLAAAGLAHSANFLFNGHLWGVLKTYGLVALPPARRQRYLAGLERRLRAEPALRFAAVYGSHARGELGACSDVDLRLVRRSGLRNGCRACWFLLRERSLALLARVPLDAYLLDSDAGLGRLRPDEQPVVLLGDRKARREKEGADDAG
jgi:hypothetical protein